ncbi:MAG: glycosyltransferase [Bacteroidia bacterium]|nr:glycosyltransferase [Bacteroidia bacterium]
MKENKKLILFTGSYPFGKGEGFIGSELKYISKEFESVEIIPVYYGESRKPRQVPGNVSYSEPLLKENMPVLLLKGIFNRSPVIPFLKEVSSIRNINCSSLLRWFKIFIGTRILLQHPKLKTLFNEKKNIFYFYWGTGASYIIPFIQNKSIIVRLHGSDLYEESNPLFLRHMIFSQANRIVFVSDFGMQYFTAKYPEFSHKTFLFKLGTEDFGKGSASNDSTFRIVSCSSVIELKRVWLISQALSLITDRHILWTHIGDGPLRNKLEQEIKTLPSNISVRLTGHLSIENIIAFYQTYPVDLFINVSSTEGLPVSVMEAISFGIPVIATNVGGTREIVDHETGLLLQKETGKTELAEAIKKMINIDLTDYRKSARLRWEQDFSASDNYGNFAKFLKTI